MDLKTQDARLAARYPELRIIFLLPLAPSSMPHALDPETYPEDRPSGPEVETSIEGKNYSVVILSLSDE